MRSLILAIVISSMVGLGGATSVVSSDTVQETEDEGVTMDVEAASLVSGETTVSEESGGSWLWKGAIAVAAAGLCVFIVKNRKRE